jgi:hypothetical protein
MNLKIIGFIIFVFFTNIVSAEIIYVSKSTGASDGDGSESNPYLTINAALTVAESGDVINILDGTYRETVIVLKSGITITTDNDSVYITGTDVVDGFEDAGNGICKSYCPTKVTQVFFDGVPQVKAKYPNQNPDRNLFNFTTIAVNYSEGKVVSSEITQPDGFFDGATVWMITGHRWVAGSCVVSSHTGNTLKVTSCTHNYYGDGIAIISNCKNCFDNDGEWYWANDTLYYKNSLVDINDLKVEAKIRETLIHFNGVQNVTINNINGYAGSVLFDNSRYCVLKNGDFKYLKDYDKVPGSYMRGDWNTVNSQGQGIAMYGTSDTLSRCNISWAAGDCLTLYGINNVVNRCVIHDGNYRATDCGVISIGGYGNKLLRSEVYNGGRDIIISNGKAFKIRYNEIYNTGLLAWDLGGFYTWHTDGGNAEIAFNHVHDCYSGNPDNSWGAVGIYLDNGSSNFLVHHNVVYNIKGMGIQYNYPGYRLRSYNNTIYNTTRAMGFVGGEMGDITAGECKLYNNYSDKGMLDNSWVEGKNNVISNNDYLVNRDEKVFIPKSDSPLIDEGMVVSEISYIQTYGTAPDIGAYEFGLGEWDVGPESYRVYGGEHDTVPVPENIVVADLTSTSVTLDWDNSTEQGITGYRVKRSLTEGGPYEIIDNVDSSGYTDINLHPLTNYYYVVTAVDSYSYESDPSQEVVGTTLEPAPLPEPKSFYDFQETTGTLVSDSGMAKNDGILKGSNIRWVSSEGIVSSENENPRCIEITSSTVHIGTSFVEVPYADFHNGDNYTFSAWVKWNTAVNADWAYIFWQNGNKRGSNEPHTRHVDLWWDLSYKGPSSVLHDENGKELNFRPASSGDDMYNGDWHLVAISLENDTIIRIYKDGIKTGEYISDTPIIKTAETNDLQIGSMPRLNMVGMIDRVRIYDTALTDEQMVSLFYGEGPGSTTTTTVMSLSQNNPLTLEQNIPNPFRERTTIDYSISKACNVKLQVLDMAGRVVETLADSRLQPGKYSVSWNASGYSAGIYFYRIMASDNKGVFNYSKKMILLNP